MNIMRKLAGTEWGVKASWYFLCKALVSYAKLNLLSLPEEGCFNLVFIGFALMYAHILNIDLARG
jgi:hypothetical protein